MARTIKMAMAMAICIFPPKDLSEDARLDLCCQDSDDSAIYGRSESNRRIKKSSLRALCIGSASAQAQSQPHLLSRCVWAQQKAPASCYANQTWERVGGKSLV